jgi:Cof subfamily protein (haloacid dehalogenase superfamily)
MSLLFDPSPELVEKMLGVNFVVMDVDGTISSADDRTAIAVSQILGRLNRASVRWSFATGRSIAGLYSTIADVMAAQKGKLAFPAICYNGAVVFVPGEPSILSTTTISIDDTRSILEVGRRLELPASVYTCENALGTPIELVYSDVAAKSNTPDINSMSFQYAKDWDAINLASTVAILLELPPGRPNVHLSEIRSILSPRVHATTSGGPYYEFTNSNTSKGLALARMIQSVHSLGSQFKAWAKFSDISMQTTMAIGDNLNDVDMLQAAAVAVAVSNSRDEVKEAADLVTSLPAGRGVVEALRLLLDVKKYRS